MDWYETAYESCADNHDPAEWDGREWDELTDEERDAEVMDFWPSRADGLRVAAKYGDR